jgi:hypothetical protein
MKNKPINTNKNSSSREKHDHELEQLLKDLIAHLRKSGTICGTGDEMEELRRKKFG